eukprot:2035625-Rhodomonas_salina.7
MALAGAGQRRHFQHALDAPASSARVRDAKRRSPPLRRPQAVASPAAPESMPRCPRAPGPLRYLPFVPGHARL